MTVDFDKLKAGLAQLTGRDYVEAERMARRLGDTSYEIVTSKSFQAVLASKALGVEYKEIEALSLADFAMATMVVVAFLENTANPKGAQVVTEMKATQ